MSSIRHAKTTLGLMAKFRAQMFEETKLLRVYFHI